MKFNSRAIFVKDIKKAKDFYTGYLGFSVEHDFGKNLILNSGLTIWEIQPDHIISRRLKTNNKSNRFELYFEEDNIEELFSEIQKAGVRFLHPIHEEPWGQRTFRFYDPDDHLIEIGEPLEVFVYNLKKNGLTQTQISKKTGIPINTVHKLLENGQ